MFMTGILWVGSYRRVSYPAIQGVPYLTLTRLHLLPRGCRLDQARVQRSVRPCAGTWPRVGVT